MRSRRWHAVRFRTPHRIGERIDRGRRAAGASVMGTITTSFLTGATTASPRFAARVHEPRSGRGWRSSPPNRAFSSTPAAASAAERLGKGGHVYARNAALALEPQHFPDSPNHPDFRRPFCGRRRVSIANRLPVLDGLNRHILRFHCLREPSTTNLDVTSCVARSVHYCVAQCASQSAVCRRRRRARSCARSDACLQERSAAIRGARQGSRGSHDARGKGPADEGRRAGDPAPRRSRSTTGGTRRCTAWRAPAWPRCFRRRSASPPRGTTALMFRMATVISDEARAKYHEYHPQRQPPALPGTHLLVAEHQPLSRSALGTRTGDVRRGSVPHRPARACSSFAGCRATTPSTSRPSRR